VQRYSKQPYLQKKNVSPANEDSDSEGKNLNSEMETPAYPMEQSLKWLDEGLPDLSGYHC
jgi:hypothetical protein